MRPLAAGEVLKVGDVGIGDSDHAKIMFHVIQSSKPPFFFPIVGGHLHHPKKVTKIAGFARCCGGFLLNSFFGFICLPPFLGKMIP